MTRWVAFVSVGVGECQSEDPFVCFGAKPTQRACLRDFPCNRKRTREWRPRSRTGESEGESRWLLGCVDPDAGLAKMSQHSRWLCGNFAQIHARDSSQNAWKVSQTSLFLRLELTQVLVWLFSFPYTLMLLFTLPNFYLPQGVFIDYFQRSYSIQFIQHPGVKQDSH